MENACDNLVRTEAELSAQGISIAHLRRSAEIIPHLLDPSQTEMSFVEFHTLAGRLPYWQDFDVGALILETVADDLPDGPLKEVLYRHALYRAQLCASAASAGGEGLARMIHVNELKAKREAQPSAGTYMLSRTAQPLCLAKKNMIEEIEWTWNDGWLLIAIFLVGADKSAPLYMVIGAADATNHAIPTTQELTRAFTKFVQCGLITVAGDQYTVCPEHIPAIKKAFAGKGGLFESGDKGLKFLKRSQLVQKNNLTVTLTDVEVEAAYKEYINAMRKR